MIDENIKKWHLLIEGNLDGGFDELLADDVVFFSPVVFTPQKGKDLTKLYLMVQAIRLAEMALLKKAT